MRRLVLLGLSTAFLMLPACGDDDGPTGGNGGNGGGTAPASIAAISGNGQRVAVGRQTLAALAVRVRDSQNRNVQNARVNWAVTAGGGSLASASVAVPTQGVAMGFADSVSTTTNSDGEASVVLTVGSGAGDNTVSATTVEGTNVAPATFTIRAVAAATATKFAGDGQMARISQPLAAPFTLRVTASDGGPVPNLPVSWQVAGGGGTLSATSTATDADGRASVVLTLGSTPVANSVSATAGGLGAQTFDATATTPVGVEVEMNNLQFVSDDITIMLGDTVTWANRDAARHTATSTSTPTGGTAFGSGDMNQSDTFSYVPDVRGDWVYYCEWHPTTMRDARIVVQ